MTTLPGFRVLVADDEPFMLRLLDATFRKGQCAVSLCRDGMEALARAAAWKPDLIVLDVMMPGLDGLKALRQLKQSEATRAIPVIVLSAKGEALTPIEAVEAGAAVFLTKPFSPAQLLAEARRLLGAAASAHVSPASEERGADVIERCTHAR